MKEDKDLLKELLQAKFKDDVIESSGDHFDSIFDAVQEKSDDKGLFFWYTIGFILLLLIGVSTSYYFLNKKTTIVENKLIENPIKQDTVNLVTVIKDTIATPQKEKNNPIIPTQNTVTETIKTTTEESTSTKVDVTTLAPEDEIKETGEITITYTASNKYAFTERTKYNPLPDSSMIVVRKNSTVNFTERKQGYRKAVVTGTVFFTIHKNKTKPFIIFGKHAKIQVAGSSFAIRSQPEADIMTLINGTAKVVHNTTKAIRDLMPGESLSVDKNGITFLKKSPNQFAWKTGNLQYNNASVNEIIQDLGKNYDAKIILNNADILNCTYSGSFEKATTLMVLNTLTTTLQLEMIKKDGVFIISGKGCAQ